MAADEVDAEPTKDGVLTFKLDNQAPVALDDLTISLHTLAQSYEDYLSASGLVQPEEGIKLYVHELREPGPSLLSYRQSRNKDIFSLASMVSYRL
jgi:hypothetical protein